MKLMFPEFVPVKHLYICEFMKKWDFANFPTFPKGFRAVISTWHIENFSPVSIYLIMKKIFYQLTK